MKNNKRKQILIIAGATASGKSSLALNIYHKNFNKIDDNIKRTLKKHNLLNNDYKIISADSRQIYKNIPIFSGIDTKEKKEKIELIKIINEDIIFSAGDFEEIAIKKIDNFLKNNQTPIIVGGTSFYLKSLLFENFLPKVDVNIKLRKSIENKSLNELLKILEKLDPERLKTIDKNNKPRIIRSIEIATELGYVPKIKEKIKEKYNFIFIWIKIDIEKQKKLIEKNFKKRANKDFFDEALKLKKYFEKLNWNNEKIKKKFFKLGLSYKFIFDFWNNKISKEEFINLGIKEEQRYAKRQNTYLKKFFNNLPKEVIKIELEKD